MIELPEIEPRGLRHQTVAFVRKSRLSSTYIRCPLCKASNLTVICLTQVVFVPFCGVTRAESAIVTVVIPQWYANLGGNSMTQRQTTRSQVMRRIGVALAATIAVSTVATTGSQASTHVSKYGGKVKVAISDTFPGFCFGDNNGSSALMMQRTVYEGLFEKTVGGDMVGLLAASGTPSADLKEWTIKLRPNITFSDGAVFDAAAVKLNLDYASGKNSIAVAQAAIPGFLANPKFTTIFAILQTPTGAPIAAALGLSFATPAAISASRLTAAFVTAMGVFASGGAVDVGTGGLLTSANLAIPADTAWAASTFQLSTATAFVGNFKNVEVIDPLTVKITLVRGQNDLPNTLYASGRFFMRSPAQFINGKTICSQKPIGTGPFKVADDYKLVRTDEVVVYKNASYWRKDPVTKAKLPYLDQITFTTVKESSQRAAALRTGKYDAGIFGSAGDARQIKDLRLRKSVVKEYKSPIEFYPSLWLNQGKVGSPFANKDARLAVLSCLDRVNFVKVRAQGEAIVAKSLVGPRSIMYTTRGFQKYDPEASKAYVAAYKTTTGKDLEFIFPADTSSQSVASAKFFQTTWAKCGIKTDIVVEEAAQIIGKMFNAGKTGAAQNAYDAIFGLLLEGTDVSFNMPFLLSQAIEPTGQGAAWASVVGTVLSLNHPTPAAAKVSDDAMKAGQASTNKSVARLKYQEAIAFLQTEAFMGSVAHGYTGFFATKKSGIQQSIGKLQLVKGKTQRTVTNWGIDWTGVYKSK